MKAQKNFRSVASAALMCLLALSACTKTKDTVSMVSPDAYVKKSDYDGKVFSLVRGIEDADGNNGVGATPGMSQDFGFVKVRITDTEVQFIEVGNLGKTAGTQSILASYTIKDHFDIEREQNDFGESTHKIVEKKDRPAKDRAFMRVDWSTPSNRQSKLASSFDFVDVPAENVVLLQDPKNENGHISWVTEFSAEGASRWWMVTPNSRVVIRTHLMPVVATDYQKLNYRDSDFKRFGYFSTQQNLEDPEKGPLDAQLEDHTFANMHNVCEPGRKDANGKALSCSTNKIVWHLTKNFPAKYLAITRRAVSEWNDTFKEAMGRTDDVVVLDETLPVDLVDPRYNTIALYPDKSSGGLLGVAQWASNPETGELISTRATVYEDGIRGTLGMVDDIITLILSDDEVRQAFLATDDETRERVDRIFQKNSGLSIKSKTRKLRANVRTALGLSVPHESAPVQKSSNMFEVRRSVDAIARKLQEPVSKGIARKATLMASKPEFFATAEQSRMGGDIFGFDQAFGLLGAKHQTASRLPATGGLEYLHDVGSGLKEERQRMMNQARSGVHGAELVQEAALRYIKKVLAEHPEAADFKAQVETIKQEVDQKTFYTTLVHEMGHTFGLRHNFQGSADAKHYHPEFFRLTKQMEAEKALPEDQKTVTVADLEPYMFSSIMDYGGDFYSQVGGIGPYDKAAIRYAYNRSIDKQNDPIVKENYQFCTDHQVNETILCRRFDKGRNATEITFNLIETYQTNWVLSHMRRGRANFESRARALPINALTRYFVPVRQVMDEFLYALVKAKPVAAKENECDMEYWKRSVDKAEIANICNPLEAERAGVDPTNLETFEQALFNSNGDLRKSPDQLEPYGLADLLLANLMAKQFFSEVLGSTTPGRFIVLQGQQKGTYDLERLPPGKDLEESLTAFASGRGIPMNTDLMGQLKNISGELKVGRYAKQFDSEWDESGSNPMQKNVGSFWDKYVAMVALGIKDIGVQKYYNASMTGNAYVYPHTNSFARQIMKSMITQKDRIVQVPFKVPAGSVMASVEPMLNADVRSIATITALTDFVSDGDETIADKMRVCTSSEQGCQPMAGLPVVQFTSASGQDVYRSAQTMTGDSISFEMLTAASAIDKQRQEWVAKAGEAANVAADNIMKMDALGPARTSLEKTLSDLGIKDLSDNLPILLGTDPKQMSVWQIVNILAARADAVPLFTTMNFAQLAVDNLNGAMQIIAGEVSKLDPDGSCKVAPAATVTATSMPAVIGLDSQLKQIKNTLSAIMGVDPSKRLAAQAAPPAAPKADCSAVGPRLKVLASAQDELTKFATTINEVLNSAVEVKTAPLRAKRLTDELARSEANIKFIRKVSKATGLE